MAAPFCSRDVRVLSVLQGRGETDAPPSELSHRSADHRRRAVRRMASAFVRLREGFRLSHSLPVIRAPQRRFRRRRARTRGRSRRFARGLRKKSPGAQKIPSVQREKSHFVVDRILAFAASVCGVLAVERVSPELARVLRAAKTITDSSSFPSFSRLSRGL